MANTWGEAMANAQDVIANGGSWNEISSFFASTLNAIGSAYNWALNNYYGSNNPSPIGVDVAFVAAQKMDSPGEVHHSQIGLACRAAALVLRSVGSGGGLANALDRFGTAALRDDMGNHLIIQRATGSEGSIMHSLYISMNIYPTVIRIFPYLKGR